MVGHETFPDGRGSQVAEPSVPSCDTGLAGRLHFVATELVDAFRRERGKRGLSAPAHPANNAGGCTPPKTTEVPR